MDKTCDLCRHVYMYELIHEEQTWSRKFLKQWWKCCFCDKIEYKTVRCNPNLKRKRSESFSDLSE